MCRAHDHIPRARPFRLARPGRSGLLIPRPRPFRRGRLCPESHLSHLIPANPASNLSVARIPLDGDRDIGENSGIGCGAFVGGVRRHDSRTGFCRTDRKHAADPSPRPVRGDRVRDPRQVRVPEPRRLGQGPRRALHRARCRAAGRAETRRDHRRRHRRQHRHRACAGRQRPRLPLGDRDSRDPEPGKEGHAAALRCGADRGAGGPLSRPQQLREVFRAPRRRDCREGAERRGLGQPVRQRSQPPGPYRDDGARDLGPDRGQDRRLHLRRRHRRHARRASAWRSRSASPRW